MENPKIKKSKIKSSNEFYPSILNPKLDQVSDITIIDKKQDGPTLLFPPMIKLSTDPK